MTRDEDHYILSTGRKIYANCGFIGIPAIADSNDDPTKFSEGYDGHIHLFSFDRKLRQWQKDEQKIEWLLTHDEGIEICDAMIQAWKQRRKVIRRASR